MLPHIKCIGVRGGGGGVTLLPEKITQCPKASVLLFKRSQPRHLTSYETVIIPKIVILKPRILYDLDQQPSKIRNL